MSLRLPATRLLLCLVAGWTALAGETSATAKKKSCCRRTTFVREEIFGNKHSAKLVAEARSFDPNYARREKADRDKAIALYQEAMALQPGAAANAALALRIAQLHAYYEDRSKGAMADPAAALPWWQRAIEASNPSQFLWVEAHMGLGSSRFLTGDRLGAADAFRTVLRADPDAMNLPDWKVWPEGKTDRERALLKEARDCTRERTDKARLKAVENIHYALIRHDGAAALTTLLDIAKAYQGTAAAEQATELALKAVRTPSSSVYRYRGLPEALSEELARLAASQTGEARAPETEGSLAVAGGPEGAPEPAAAGAQPPEAPVAGRTPAARGGLGRAGEAALVGAAVVVALACVFLVRRAVAARRAL